MSISVSATSSSLATTSGKKHSSQTTVKSSGRSYKEKKINDLGKSLKEFERLKKLGVFPTEPIKLQKSLVNKSCFSTNCLGRLFVKAIPLFVVIAVLAEAIIISVDSFRDRENCKISLGSAISRIVLCVLFTGIGIAVHQYEKLKEKDEQALIYYREEEFRKFTFSVFLTHFNELKKLVELTNQQYLNQLNQNADITLKAHKCLKKLSKCNLKQMHFSPEMWVSLIIYLMNTSEHNDELKELIQNALKFGHDSPRKKDNKAEDVPPRKKRSKKFQGESAAAIPIEIIDRSPAHFQRTESSNLFSQIKQMGCTLDIRAILVNDENGEHCIGLDGIIYDDIQTALDKIPDDSVTIDIKSLY